jgi:hypothetical protein
VPVFTAERPTPYTVFVTMTPGPQGAAFQLGRDLEMVLDEPAGTAATCTPTRRRAPTPWKSGSG